MICGTCGSAVAEGGADPICPKCSFNIALGAPQDGEEARAIEGYELLTELGRGAMGIVWLARERALSRLVALKVIATGSNPVLSQRLLREGQAAARLRHPNIVAVHALGGTGASTFLAMDFIEGGNLDEKLRREPMGGRAAAEMMVKLADALACAHGLGIVHRDIKPSNILLDGNGEPCLADFGLAAPIARGGDLTIAGQVAGTPSYMAPELLLGADRASAHSDLYSLGAVLYTCLTGRPPFAGKTPAAIFALVADEDPVEPRRLQPEVARDLETICLKCLEKAPSRRYASAGALRDDLGRFLRGEPIDARPAGRMEKVVRWCVRKPAAATSVGLAAAILLLLSVGVPLELVRLARSRNAAEFARAQAASEAATSAEVVGFLQNDLLSQASPENQPDRDLKLREVLERASKRIEGRFADKPLVEATIRETLANTYQSIGAYPTAQHHMERAAELRARMAGPDDPSALRDASTVAFLVAVQGKYPEAEQKENAALSAQERVLGTRDKDTLVTMAHLAFILFSEGKLAEAEAVEIPALAAKRAVMGPEDPSTVDSMHDLALIYGGEGKFSDSERVELETLNSQEKILGPSNPQVLLTMNNLGNNYLHEGKYAEAGRLLEQALELEEHGAGVDHPVEWFLTNNLAAVRRGERRYADAEALYGRCIEIGTRVYGQEHPNTVFAMWGLASVYRDEGNLPKAAALFVKTLEMRRRVLEPGHPETLSSEDSLGEVLLAMGRLDESETLLRECFAARAKDAPGSWRTQATGSLLGGVLEAKRNYAEAEPLLVDAIRVLRKEEGQIPALDRHMISDTERRLFRLYTDWGRPADAEGWRRTFAEEDPTASIH